MERSAEALTLTVLVAVLLPGVGSVVVLVTVAVFPTTLPWATLLFTLATIVIVAVAALASVPIVQFGADQEPTEGVALTKVIVAGSTSATETACASDVPLFVTVMV